MTRIKPHLVVLFSLIAIRAFSQVAIMPEQFRVNLQAEEIVEEMKFFNLKYKTPVIDLRELQDLVAIELPDSVVITPPDLSKFDHVVVLIGLTKGGDESTMVVWLAGNYNYRNITFYIDFDQDRDFTNDKGPIRIRAGGVDREVILTKKGESRKLILTVPEITVKRIEKYRVRISNRLALAFHAGVGSGEISYGYDDLIIGWPTTYFVKITEKNLSTAISYDFKNFNIGISGSFQNHYYFTTHLDVKRGEPYFVPDPDGGRSTYVENTDHHVNLDSHSNNRVQWGAFGTYKFRVGRAIDLQAKLLVGKTSYFNPEYNRFVNEENQIYPLKASPFYEIGLRSEFTTGIARAFYFEIAFNKNEWNPQGFLDDTPHTNYESSSQILKLNVGYRFAL